MTKGAVGLHPIEIPPTCNKLATRFDRPGTETHKPRQQVTSTKSILRLLLALGVLCARATYSQTPTPALSLRNDRINFYATVAANQNSTSLLWDGGRNGVLPGESLLVEARTPSSLRSIDLLYSLTGDDVHVTWQFDVSPGTSPTFPLAVQQGSVSISDIDWRDSSGNIYEQGVVGVQILSGNWAVTSFGPSGVGFQFTGSSISSLTDLSFTARLFNSTTVPEPSALALLGTTALLLPHRASKTTVFGRLRAQPELP
jgi:hypothetical protein